MIDVYNLNILTPRIETDDHGCQAGVVAACVLGSAYCDYRVAMRGHVL